MIELLISFRRAFFFWFSLVFSSALVAAPAAKLIKFWDDHEPKSVMTTKHGPWQEILGAYVDDEHPSGINRFNYKAVSDADLTKLTEYLSYLQMLEPRQFNSSEAKAYWLNFYNALLVKKVIEAVREDDIRSVKSLGNRIWRRDIAYVVMQDISLDDIEHGILRPIWNDPRIHYGLTSGALGGGNLQKVAYTGANVEELLAKAEKEFLNHDRGIRVSDGRATASSIFDWYRTDFVASKSELVPYIAQRVDDAKRAELEGIRRVRYDYDWTLNSPDADE